MATSHCCTLNTIQWLQLLPLFIALQFMSWSFMFFVVFCAFVIELKHLNSLPNFLLAHLCFSEDIDYMAYSDGKDNQFFSLVFLKRPCINYPIKVSVIVIHVLECEYVLSINHLNYCLHKSKLLNVFIEIIELSCQNIQNPVLQYLFNFSIELVLLNSSY